MIIIIILLITIIIYNISLIFDENYQNYNTQDYNTQYHDTIDVIQKQNDIYNTNFNFINVIDDSGNDISLPYSPAQPTVVYNKPGTFYYGISKYVPDYKDSILLSSFYNNKPNK
jgi:hypothetical protein